MLKYPLKKFLKYCKKTYHVEKLLKQHKIPTEQVIELMKVE